eukprot:4388311-Amphidinium_carterae.1
METLNSKVRAHDQVRISRWRNEMMQIGPACRYVRGAVAQRTTAITTTEGELAVGFEQMDTCLQAFWTKVAHPKNTTLAEVSQYVTDRASTWPQREEAAIIPFSADVLSKLIARTRKHTAPARDLGGQRS